MAQEDITPKTHVQQIEQASFEDSTMDDAEDDENKDPRTCLKTYWPAALWCCGMAMQNVMEGYNLSIGASIIVFPAFLRKYGEDFGEPLHWQLPFRWQMAITMAATAGGIVGAIVGGYLIDLFGARKVVMGSHTFLAGAIFMQFYAPTIQVLVGATIVCGLPWGMIASVGSIYASEVCPTALRGYLINFSNIAFVFGTMLCALVLLPMGNIDSEWSYRIPYAIQWVWPVPLFLIALCAPESPWWLMRKGREHDAEKTLRRIARGQSDDTIAAKMELMRRTNEFEKTADIEVGFLDIFKGSNLRRTEIASLVMASQGLTGMNVAGSPTYFMLQIGLSSSAALGINIGTTGLQLVANFICWPLMAYFGRRHLLMTGFGSAAIVLLLIAVLDSSHTGAARWGQGAMCIIWSGIYASTVAPVSYSVAGEVSATRTRSQTINFSKAVFGICACVSSVIQTFLVNPTGGVDLKGKSAYPWFACAASLLIWAFFRLPETKGLTYEELDVLFEDGVHARQFKSYPVGQILAAKQNVGEEDEAIRV